MADKEIPDMTDGGAAASGDLVHVVRGANSRKVALGDAAGKNIPWTGATSSGAASLLFAEDTDNGSHKVTLQAPAALAADRTVTLPDTTGTLALLSQTLRPDVEDQTISGGARVTVKDLGNLSGNSITPDPGDRAIQKITNNGAGSILPGSNEGQYTLAVINASGAGAITTTGWTLKGDAFDTTTTSKFLCSCVVISDIKLMSIRKVA